MCNQRQFSQGIVNNSVKVNNIETIVQDHCPAIPNSPVRNHDKSVNKTNVLNGRGNDGNLHGQSIVNHNRINEPTVTLNEVSSDNNVMCQHDTYNDNLVTLFDTKGLDADKFVNTMHGTKRFDFNE